MSNCQLYTLDTCHIIIALSVIVFFFLCIWNIFLLFITKTAGDELQGVCIFFIRLKVEYKAK